MGRWFRRQFPLPSDPHIGIHAGVTFPARLGTRPRVPPLIAGAEFQTTSGSGTLLDNYSVAVLNFTGQECAGETVADLALHQDRKSTGLNSSHVAISYAVFCLKTKKRNIHICPYIKQ